MQQAVHVGVGEVAEKLALRCCLTFTTLHIKSSKRGCLLLVACKVAHKILGDGDDDGVSLVSCVLQMGP